MPSYVIDPRAEDLSHSLTGIGIQPTFQSDFTGLWHNITPIDRAIDVEATAHSTSGKRTILFDQPPRPYEEQIEHIVDVVQNDLTGLWHKTTKRNRPVETETYAHNTYEARTVVFDPSIPPYVEQIEPNVEIVRIVANVEWSSVSRVPHAISEKTDEFVAKDEKSKNLLRILRNAKIQNQVVRLLALRDGWLDGDGKAPSEQGIEWLLSVLFDSFPHDAPLPSLYPTEDGDVQAEWRIEQKDISLEIDLEQRRGEWHCLDLQSGETTTRTIQCDDSAHWKWVGAQLT